MVIITHPLVHQPLLRLLNTTTNEQNISEQTSLGVTTTHYGVGSQPFPCPTPFNHHHATEKRNEQILPSTEEDIYVDMSPGNRPYVSTTSL